MRAKLAADEQRDVINLLLNDFEENAADWLWGVDGNLVIERASTRFYEQLQVPEAMVIGKPLVNILPFSSVGIDGLDCRQKFVSCLEGRQSFRDQDICVELGVNSRSGRLTAKAMFDDRGVFYRLSRRGPRRDREPRKPIAHRAHGTPRPANGSWQSGHARRRFRPRVLAT